MHGSEIPDFERLFLATKQAYVDAGIDIHYETDGDRGRHRRARRSRSTGEGDGLLRHAWCIATGFDYADPGVPGGDLERPLLRQEHPRGHGVGQGPRHGRSRPSSSRPRPLGLEMVDRARAPRHRDPPGRPEPVGRCRRWPTPTSWRRSRSPGARWACTLHFNTTLEAFLGDERPGAGGARPPTARSPPTSSWSAPTRSRTTPSAAAAGLKIGSTGGIIVDERMATSAPGVWAAGDCTEIPHGSPASRSRACPAATPTRRARSAGTNAAGGDRAYQPVYVPVGHGRRQVDDRRRVASARPLATALGIPYVVGAGAGHLPRPLLPRRASR